MNEYEGLNKGRGTGVTALSTEAHLSSPTRASNFEGAAKGLL